MHVYLFTCACNTRKQGGGDFSPRCQRPPARLSGLTCIGKCKHNKTSVSELMSQQTKNRKESDNSGTPKWRNQIINIKTFLKP